MATLELFGMHLLTFLFFFGMIGSSVVIAVSLFKDIRDLTGDD